MLSTTTTSFCTELGTGGLAGTHRAPSRQRPPRGLDRRTFLKIHGAGSGFALGESPGQGAQTPKGRCARHE